MLWVIVFIVVMLVAIYGVANSSGRTRVRRSGSGTADWSTPYVGGDSSSHHRGDDGGASHDSGAGGSDGGASCGGGGGCGGGD